MCQTAVLPSQALPRCVLGVCRVGAGLAGPADGAALALAVVLNQRWCGLATSAEVIRARHRN